MIGCPARFTRMVRRPADSHESKSENVSLHERGDDVTTQLKLLVRVVKRRVGSGEDLEEVLKDYPKLKPAEADEVRAAVGKEESHE